MTPTARSKPVLSVLSLAATAIALGGIVTLGNREVRTPGALASLMLYVFGGAMAVLTGLGSVIRHEGKWSWIAMSATPFILLAAWLNSH
jgi:hypothetical protein